MGRVIFLGLLRDCQPAHGLNVQPFWMQTKVRETSRLHGDKMHSHTKLITILRRSMHDSEALCSVGSQEWTHLRLPHACLPSQNTPSKIPYPAAPKRRLQAPDKKTVMEAVKKMQLWD